MYCSVCVVIAGACTAFLGNPHGTLLVFLFLVSAWPWCWGTPTRLGDSRLGTAATENPKKSCLQLCLVLTCLIQCTHAKMLWNKKSKAHA